MSPIESDKNSTLAHPELPGLRETRIEALRLASEADEAANEAEHQMDTYVRSTQFLLIRANESEAKAKDLEEAGKAEEAAVAQAETVELRKLAEENKGKAEAKQKEKEELEFQMRRHCLEADRIKEQIVGQKMSWLLD